MVPHVGSLPRLLDEALHKAALYGNAALPRALIYAGAPILYTDRYAAAKIPVGSALHAVLPGGAPQLLELITSVYRGQLYTATLGEEAVHDSNKYLTTSVVTTRATAVANAKMRSLVDARDGDGFSSLHVGAETVATGAAELFLLCGADVDATDDMDRSPLQMAARYGNTETAAFLIWQGPTQTI